MTHILGVWRSGNYPRGLPKDAASNQIRASFAELIDMHERPLHFEPLRETLERFGYANASDATLAGHDAFHRHGDVPRWQKALDTLPRRSANRYTLDQPLIEIGARDELDASTHYTVHSALRALCPWRKGPFRVFGIDVDAEWRSDAKWARVQRSVTSLDGHRVLDVGCGNGYYCLRALGAGAASALGVDPNPLFVLQFELLKRLLPALPATVLPLGFEVLPSHPRGFDTVFSMGVLYHRKAPLEHLRRLGTALAEGGQLVLETLIVDSSFGPVLEPRGRYANMNNVWSIPSIPELLKWLDHAGFTEALVTDVTVTSTAEQRTTPWSSTHSLGAALDSSDSTKTVEGYPAPQRAMVVARR